MRQEVYMQKVKEKNKMQPKTYYILTMGCQLNENDSERLAGMMQQMGYEQTLEVDKADVTIINTCCVRENAEDKLLGKLGELKKVKQNTAMLIAVGGCMMQEKHMVEKLKRSYPFVDILFGTHTLQRFPQDLYEALENKEKIEDIWQCDGEIYEGLPIKRQSSFQASVTIMNGCNNFCTYCIVPYVRGRERSRKPSNILEEIEQLANKGYKEITLLGQNVNSYQGKGENGITTFAHLLRKVNEINGIERIRFLSPHPKDFSQDVIEAIRDCKKISKIIHLPLQSGSSKILEKMNRKYTKEQYLALVEKMKQEIPGVVFSTDIMVGFPEETNEDLEDTLDVVRKVQFEQVYMFLYSRRVSTPADKMENQIPEKIKHERFNQLKQLVESQVKQNNQKYIKTKQTVLVEGKSKTNETILTGRTDTNKVVNFEGPKELIGTFVDLEIVSEHMWYLKGERIK